ncbi:Shedu immune nuclease family protein [Rhizobium sp. 32_C3_N1_1]|uniref:Shedu immune nuclease family protein n=1 Tax=Rhizobium sp. 32_C3_N1_1 TaxID=3240771 RepID=UPI003F21D989
MIEAELGKYQLLREMISGWLASSASYSEKDWQRLILKVVLLLLPKYVAVLENVQIIDAYSAPGQKKKRFIDVCLIDAGGNLDVVEVKKPFDDALLSKSLYRGNSIPSKELSGAIMQAEKYLFHLSKWGVDGEAELTKRHAKQLPPAMQIRITNPKALLLLGRDMRHSGAPAFSEQQKFDLEVIKRKYANMMDILTYDDLLRRLDNIIASLSQRRAALA